MEITEDSYIVQPNAVSRAVYNMPVMARRLILLAVFNVQTGKPAEMRFSMDLRELALQFGFKKTKRYTQLKNAIDLASKQVLRFSNEHDAVTELFPWLTYCRLNLNTNIVTIQINEYLHSYVLDIQQSEGFAVFLLSDFLKLESRYSIRWFEIVVSRSGHADSEGHFFVRYPLAEIKILFVVDGKKYKTKDFRIKIIEMPIKEINNKKIGYHIFPEYVHKNKKLTEVILRCQFTKRENGKDTPAYFLSRHTKEYFKCVTEAGRLLAVKQFKDQRAYEIARMQKALELLKMRIPHE